jgi:hypothetical protein
MTQFLHVNSTTLMLLERPTSWRKLEECSVNFSPYKRVMYAFPDSFYVQVSSNTFKVSSF